MLLPPREDTTRMPHTVTETDRQTKTEPERENEASQCVGPNGKSLALFLVSIPPYFLLSTQVIVVRREAAVW